MFAVAAAQISVLNHRRLVGQRETFIEGPIWENLPIWSTAHRFQRCGVHRREVSACGAAPATGDWLRSSSTATKMATEIVWVQHRSLSRDRTSTDANLRAVLQCPDWYTMWRTPQQALKGCDARNRPIMQGRLVLAALPEIVRPALAHKWFRAHFVCVYKEGSRS